jgi:hypothetical protein
MISECKLEDEKSLKALPKPTEKYSDNKGPAPVLWRRDFKISG